MNMQSVLDIQPGMAVFTTDAFELGTVKQVREHDMLVDRAHKRDVFVPFTYVDRIGDVEKRLELSLTEEAFNEQDWESPSLF
jgi:sporulation protein YlmC with PRC-barrel domain